MISFDLNNGRTLVLKQEAHDKPVHVVYLNADGTVSTERTIPASQFVMLNGLYWDIILNGKQNDFINPYGI